MRQRVNGRVFGLLSVVLLMFGSGLWAAGLDTAHTQFKKTDFVGAVRTLEQIRPKNAAVYELLGRSFFLLGEYKRSSEAFEAAVAAAPNQAELYHWLGKADGRRAETSSFLTAPGYASKARENFETAVRLNPKDLEAVNDLFEYYLQAPGFLGGGLDKAAKLADRIAAADPVEGLWAQARLAERRKDFDSAEDHLRNAARMAPGQVSRIIDLAKFLAKRGRFQEAEQTFVSAEKMGSDSPKLLFERAQTYIETGHNLSEARDLLKRYLASDLTPDDPPRWEAEKLLRQLPAS